MCTRFFSLSRPTSKSSSSCHVRRMDPLTEARARQEGARCIYDQKCNEAAAGETNHAHVMQGILGKAEAFEKYVKTVTMRADSLLTTETILKRHEEAKKH